MASFRFDAIPIEDVTSAWCDRWASLRATTEAPSTQPRAPAPTSSAVAVNQTRRDRFTGRTISTTAPNCGRGSANAMTLNKHQA